MKIILGSSSPWRKKVLTDMGYEFETMSPDIDEKAIRHADPAELTMAIAEAKGAAIRARVAEPAIVITSDQVVYCAGRILEKPVDEADARSHIALEGQHPVQTVTAVVAANTATGQVAKGIDIVSMTFRPMPPEVVDRIVAQDYIYSCSGSFDIDDPLAKPYLTSLEGERGSVLGLPPSLTRHLIEEVQGRVGIGDIYVDEYGWRVVKPADVVATPRPSGYALIRDVAGRILVVLPKFAPIYALPGGGVEAGETYEQAVVRECREETGYVVRVPAGEPIHVAYNNFFCRHTGRFHEAEIKVYVAEITDAPQDDTFINRSEPDEVERLEWLNPEQLDEANCYRYVLKALRLMM